MDVKTKEAVHGSIKKWNRIIAGTGIDLGRYNCPLCQLFFNRCQQMYNSQTCPFNCFGDASYRKWFKHYDKEHRKETDLKIHCPECKESAIAVRDDLKKLLEEG